MPALIKTALTAELTWIGTVADRDAALSSQPLERAELGWDGIAGEAHGGLTRPSCSRVLNQYARGTEIRNVRQLSVISAEDLADIAETLGLETLTPALLGASMVLSGLPDFSNIPPASRLQFPSGATLTVDMQNRPCHLPAREIETVHPGHGKAFKQAAKGRRGVTAWVERPGLVALGERATLFVPDQPVWSELESVRAAGDV